MSGYILEHGKRYDVFFYGPYHEVEVKLENELVLTVTYGDFYDYQFTEKFGGYHGIFGNTKSRDIMSLVQAVIRKFCKEDK